MANRGHGEGTIRQRADGRFEGRISWQEALADGRRERRRRSVYGATKREVQDEIRVLIRKQREGRIQAGRPPTVAEVLNRWLEAKQTRRRPKTFHFYESAVRVHLIPTIGHLPVDQLTPLHVEQLMAKKARQTGGTLAPRSVHSLRAVLRNALNQATRWGLVTRNVASLSEPPEVKRYKGKVLDRAEALRLLEASDKDRLGALYVLTVMTGLRQGEALGLRWSDIDLDKGTLKVHQQLQRVDKALTLVDLKTEESFRDLVIPEVAVDRLRRHRIDQKQERKWHAGPRWIEADYIFTTRIGTPLDGTNVTREFQRMLAAAGLDKMRFHDLRHSAATLMLTARVPLATISATLGHNSIRTTKDLYADVQAELFEDAAERYGAFMGGQA